MPPISNTLKRPGDEGVRVILDAPLKYNNDILGMLRFFFSESREFSKEELNFILIIAERTAAVIHRAHVIGKPAIPV